MVSFLLPYATTGLASIAAWDGSGTTPRGSAVVTCLNATARTRRAARAVQGEVLYAGQVLRGTPSALHISAHRGALFGDHFTRNLFINNTLRQRYSRYRGEAFKKTNVFLIPPSYKNTPHACKGLQGRFERSFFEAS